MKPIQTRYKGYFFRSRLEARWAVFFDHLNVEWEYEPEGFEFPDGSRYLPDFFIPGNSHYGPYVEIKGEPPTDEEIVKMSDLCEAKNAYGFILWGTPGKQGVIHFHKEGHIYSSYLHDTAGEADDNFASQFLGLPWHGSNFRSSPEYIKAVEAARSARFEFGQEGATL